MKSARMGLEYCPICGGPADFMTRLYDDRYGYPGYYELFKCGACGHRFLAVQFEGSRLTELYTDYYPRSTFDETNYKPVEVSRGFRAWLAGDARFAFSWVPEKVRVLDIGCGFGETLGYHVSRGCEAYGVEADENVRRVREKYGFNIHVGLFDPGGFKSDYFDYVTLDQVIEHFAAPILMLEGVARVLKPGGTVIVSTPNADGWGARLFRRRWINWHAPYHLHHFSQGSMRLAAQATGFQVETARTLTSSEWLHYQWNHLLLYPTMGAPSSFWSPRVERDRLDRLVLGVLSMVNRTGINHLLTRLFDALGRGDNCLYFLRKP